MQKFLLYIISFSMTVVLFSSCKKSSTNPSPSSNNSLISKITQSTSGDTTVYTLSYNADSSLANVDVKENGSHAYTIIHSYSPSYNLAIKDYGNGITERDSTTFANGKVSTMWHTDMFGSISKTSYVYGNSGYLSFAIQTTVGLNNSDTISYQWQNGNIITAISPSSNFAFTYDNTKPFQPGDYFFLNTLMNNGDMGFDVVNSNLITSATASGFGNLLYSYTWDNSGRITQCKQHVAGNDTFWDITY